MSNRIELDTAEIVRLYQSGESEQAVARLLGVSRLTIRKRLIASGITPRTQTEAALLMMSKLTPEQRQKRSAKAHEASRGRKSTIEQLERRALGVEKNLGNISIAEQWVADELRAQGLSITQQKAFGIFNVDIYIHDLNLAVEILGGNWHSSKSHKRRLDYLKSVGLNIVYVWVNGTNHPLDTDELIQRLLYRSYSNDLHVLSGNGRLIEWFGDEMPDRIPSN